MNRKKDPLHFLVINRDCAWEDAVRNAARKACIEQIRFVKNPATVTTVVKSIPYCILWNLKTIEQFDDAFQRMILERFPVSEIIAAARHLGEDDVVSMLQSGVTYFIDKNDGEEIFSRNFSQFIGFQQEIRAAGENLYINYRVRNWVDISAPSERKFLESLAEFVSLLTRTKLDELKRRSIAYAFREIGQNAIEWGNDNDPRKRFHMSFCILEDRVIIKLTDEGQGFDHEKLVDPRDDPLKHFIARRLEGKRTGGYGIAIVRGLVDEMLFNEKGNSVVLTVYFQNGRREKHAAENRMLHEPS